MNKNFKSLGKNATSYPVSYSPKSLESFPNEHKDHDNWVSVVCTEFTTLCPITSQPDFAKIFVNYIPDASMVESKSLKLYLYSFRNHKGFHEDTISRICDDLAKLLSPKYLEVIGEFTPRGGLAIYPFSNFSSTKIKYLKLKEKRTMNYAPGRYSMDLARLY